MDKQVCKIVAGDEVMREAMTKEAKWAFQNPAQSAISTITLAVSDLCIGSTTDTKISLELCNELRARYLVTAEAIIYTLLTDYLLVSIQVDESVTQYVRRRRYVVKATCHCQKDVL